MEDTGLPSWSQQPPWGRCVFQPFYLLGCVEMPFDANLLLVAEWMGNSRHAVLDNSSASQASVGKLFEESRWISAPERPPSTAHPLGIPGRPFLLPGVHSRTKFPSGLLLAPGGGATSPSVVCSGGICIALQGVFYKMGDGDGNAL